MNFYIFLVSEILYFHIAKRTNLTNGILKIYSNVLFMFQIP